MLNHYSNFVRSSSSVESKNSAVQPLMLSGDEAKRIYLEEVSVASHLVDSKNLTRSKKRLQHINQGEKLGEITKKDLFICVQNNDIKTLMLILDTYPNMLNTIDEYGWSLLMIACQANSIDAAKELLKRGINTCVRDKAGNSAQSLVIKNENLALANILLTSKSSEPVLCHKNTEECRKIKPKLNEKYLCEICNREFPDKGEHLSSTVHNISASKDKKVPSSFVIPASNKGYQIMLKVGWDRQSGLGPHGSGNKYPIKTVQKIDRKGLGLDKRKIKVQEERKETVKQVNRKLFDRECKSSRNMEINFRREFY